MTQTARQIRDEMFRTAKTIQIPLDSPETREFERVLISDQPMTRSVLNHLGRLVADDQILIRLIDQIEQSGSSPL
jgi:hypothetical protein